MENMTLEVRDGLIVKSVGGLYSVRTADGSITECRAKGSFRKNGMNPLAGDRVCFEVQKDGSGFITRIRQEKFAYTPGCGEYRYDCYRCGVGRSESRYVCAG